MAVKCGLSVADLKLLTIGYTTDYCEEFLKKGKNSDSDKYRQFKDILPIVLEEYENGEITETRYLEFMQRYKQLEEVNACGWEEY